MTGAVGVGGRGRSSDGIAVDGDVDGAGGAGAADDDPLASAMLIESIAADASGAESMEVTVFALAVMLAMGIEGVEVDTESVGARIGVGSAGMASWPSPRGEDITTHVGRAMRWGLVAVSDGVAGGYDEEEGEF